LRKSLLAAPRLLLELAHIPGLYLAGGWLRDACWGRLSDDIDLALDGDLAALLSELERVTGRRPFQLNARFESYGVEISGLRLDIMPLHSGGVTADLERRDYTVNALLFPLSGLHAARHTSSDELMQLLLHDKRSLDDLASRTLRMTSPASLKDDPLRLLRGYRLAAQWQLSVDSATRGCWRDLASMTTLPAHERLHDELLKLLSQPCARQIAMLAEDSLLWHLFPALEATRGCDQFGYHHLDVWDHTLLALQQLDEMLAALPAELAPFQTELREAWNAPWTTRTSAGSLTRLALLLHDIAKPMTRELRPDGRPSFHGHQELGARLVEPMLEGLRFSRDEIDLVSLLIREHMRLGYYSEPDRSEPKLVFRFVRKLGSATPLMVLHTLADCAATQGPLATGAFERHINAAKLVLTRYYAEDNVAQPELLLDGVAIMTLTGLTPGPAVGALKEALLEATATGEVTCRADAENFVLRLHKSNSQTRADADE
jgi:tRNA nucleotidyltransferase/poly(A) polymerase